MRLFMDLGNSLAKWAFESDIAQGRVDQVSSGNAAELIAALQRLPQPSAVFIASVLAPERTRALVAWMAEHWRLQPNFAESRDREFGVVNGYREPRQLGVDRWLGLLAARQISKAPVLVVDCGTATTLDAMDRDGRHLGGVILPGLTLFERCLMQGTDIPECDGAGGRFGFATDTATGISSGAMLATTAAVEAAMADLVKTQGQDVVMLLTGGFAPRVAQHLAAAHRLMPHLILQGLALQAGQTVS